MTLEEINELDDQDDDHHQLKHERARLVELLHHEAVEILGGLQLFLDQIFIVEHAHLLSAQLVESRRKHIAQELDGVVGTLSEFVHIEQDGMQLGRGARCAPPRPQSGPSSLEKIVNILEFARHQLVVMSKLQQLGVGVLQELNRSLRARGSVVNEGRVPSNHGKVMRIVRHTRLQDFLALAVRQQAGLAAHDLGDLVTLRREQFVGRRRAGDLAQVEDKVIFLQPWILFVVVRLHQRGGRTLELLLHDSRRENFEVRVRRPPAREFHQVIPVPRKRQLEHKADYAVVKILDLSFEALAAFEHERVKRFHNRCTLILNVVGRLILECRLGRPCTQELAQIIQPNFFANVKLDQRQHGSTQGRGGRRLRHRMYLGRHSLGDIRSHYAGKVTIHKKELAAWSTRGRTEDALEISILPEKRSLNHRGGFAQANVG